MNEQKEIIIYEQGAEEYSKTGIFFSNFIMLLWIAAGTFGCWFLSPIAAWIYLAFAIIISLFQEFTVLKIVVLIFLLLISFYSGAISRKKTCAMCKMRLICPGCAVKTK